MVFSSSNLILCPPFSTETQVKKIPHSHKIQQQQLPVKKWNAKKKKQKKKEREKALKGEEREGRDKMRQERKIYFLYVSESVQSSSSDRVWGQRRIWELAVVFIQNGGEEGKKKRTKWVESNPTRGRNQHSKAGIYSGRAFSLSGWKKISLLFSLCDVLCLVYRMKCMCKFVYGTGKLEGVSVIYMVNTVAPLTCCKRGGIFLSLFLHSFLCFSFFSQYQSPTT